MSDKLAPGIGTIVYVSTTLPAADTVAGYEAIEDVNWIKLGHLSEVPEFGPESSEVNFTPLDTGVVSKYHGEENNGSVTFPLGMDRTDAGQRLVKDARENKARIAFKIVYPKVDSASGSGAIDYIQGKVFSFMRGAATGSVVSGSVNVGFETTPREVDET
ncbi:hypothetical protein [Epibacterium ulvae]|uniref:hypothetical protein n=1 Tax=Epibacterium ulvae TaxID=1156985 RepID=UPI0024913DC8|nr:hypothetical protein [Epibacterium ulvae]